MFAIANHVNTDIAVLASSQNVLMVVLKKNERRTIRNTLLVSFPVLRVVQLEINVRTVELHFLSNTKFKEYVKIMSINLSNHAKVLFCNLFVYYLSCEK